MRHFLLSSSSSSSSSSSFCLLLVAFACLLLGWSLDHHQHCSVDNSNNNRNNNNVVGVVVVVSAFVIPTTDFQTLAISDSTFSSLSIGDRTGTINNAQLSSISFSSMLSSSAHSGGGFVCDGCTVWNVLVPSSISLYNFSITFIRCNIVGVSMLGSISMFQGSCISFVSCSVNMIPTTIPGMLATSGVNRLGIYINSASSINVASSSSPSSSSSLLLSCCGFSFVAIRIVNCDFDTDPKIVANSAKLYSVTALIYVSVSNIQFAAVEVRGNRFIPSVAPPVSWAISSIIYIASPYTTIDSCFMMSDNVIDVSALSPAYKTQWTNGIINLLINGISKSSTSTSTTATSSLQVDNNTIHTVAEAVNKTSLQTVWQYAMKIALTGSSTVFDKNSIAVTSSNQMFGSDSAGIRISRNKITVACFTFGSWRKFIPGDDRVKFVGDEDGGTALKLLALQVSTICGSRSSSLSPSPSSSSGSSISITENRLTTTWANWSLPQLYFINSTFLTTAIEFVIENPVRNFQLINVSGNVVDVAATGSLRGVNFINYGTSLQDIYVDSIDAIRFDTNTIAVKLANSVVGVRSFIYEARLRGPRLSNIKVLSQNGNRFETTSHLLNNDDFASFCTATTALELRAGDWAYSATGSFQADDLTFMKNIDRIEAMNNDIVIRCGVRAEGIDFGTAQSYNIGTVEVAYNNIIVIVLPSQQSPYIMNCMRLRPAGYAITLWFAHHNNATMTFTNNIAISSGYISAINAFTNIWSRNVLQIRLTDNNCTLLMISLGSPLSSVAAVMLSMQPEPWVGTNLFEVSRNNITLDINRCYRYQCVAIFLITDNASQIGTIRTAGNNIMIPRCTTAIIGIGIGPIAHIESSDVSFNFKQDASAVFVNPKTLTFTPKFQTTLGVRNIEITGNTINITLLYGHLIFINFYGGKFTGTDNLATVNGIGAIATVSGNTFIGRFSSAVSPPLGVTNLVSLLRISYTSATNVMDSSFTYEGTTYAVQITTKLRAIAAQFRFSRIELLSTSIFMAKPIFMQDDSNQGAPTKVPTTSSSSSASPMGYIFDGMISVNANRSDIDRIIIDNVSFSSDLFDVLGGGARITAVRYFKPASSQDVDFLAGAQLPSYSDPQTSTSFDARCKRIGASVKWQSISVPIASSSLLVPPPVYSTYYINCQRKWFMTSTKSRSVELTHKTPEPTENTSTRSSSISFTHYEVVDVPPKGLSSAALTVVTSTTQTFSSLASVAALAPTSALTAARGVAALELLACVLSNDFQHPVSPEEQANATAARIGRWTNEVLPFPVSLFPGAGFGAKHGYYARAAMIGYIVVFVVAYAICLQVGVVIKGRYRQLCNEREREREILEEEFIQRPSSSSSSSTTTTASSAMLATADPSSTREAPVTSFAPAARVVLLLFASVCGNMCAVSVVLVYVGDWFLGVAPLAAVILAGVYSVYWVHAEMTIQNETLRPGTYPSAMYFGTQRSLRQRKIRQFLQTDLARWMWWGRETWDTRAGRWSFTTESGLFAPPPGLASTYGTTVTCHYGPIGAMSRTDEKHLPKTYSPGDANDLRRRLAPYTPFLEVGFTLVASLLSAIGNVERSACRPLLFAVCACNTLGSVLIITYRADRVPRRIVEAVTSAVLLLIQVVLVIAIMANENIDGSVVLACQLIVGIGLTLISIVGAVLNAVFRILLRFGACRIVATPALRRIVRAEIHALRPIIRTPTTRSFTARVIGHITNDPDL